MADQVPMGAHSVTEVEDLQALQKKKGSLNAATRFLAGHKTALRKDQRKEETVNG